LKLVTWVFDIAILVVKATACVVRQPVLSVHIDELGRPVSPAKRPVQTIERWFEIVPSERPVAVPQLDSVVEF